MISSYTVHLTPPSGIVLYGKTIEELVELTQSLEQDQESDEQVAILQAEVANSFESMEALAKELSNDLVNNICQDCAATFEKDYEKKEG